MLINDFIKITKIVPKKINYRFFIFILFLTISSVLELVSISALIPIAEIFINGQSSFKFLNDFFQALSKLFAKSVDIYSILFVFLTIVIIKSIFLIFFSYWTNKFSQNIYKSISQNLLQKYFNNNYYFFLNHKSSDLTRNVLIETKNIGATVFCYLKAFTEIFIFFSIGVLILIIDFKSSLILIISFLFFASIYFIFTKKIIYNFGQIRQTSTGRLLKVLQEIFGSIKDIKLKKSENFFEKLFGKDINDFTIAAYKSNTINEIPRYLIEVVFVFILLLIIFTNMSNNNDFQKIIPLLAVYLAAGFRILPGVVKLSGYLQTIQSLKPSLDLLYKEFNDTERYNEKRENIINDNINFNNDIVLDKLSFGFGKKSIFKDLNLNIKNKSVTGIIGDSGSGKSTLVNLLLGFLKPDKGCIKINNIDIKNFIFKWQSNIGYVSQNIFLLDSTLKENIAFGINQEKIDIEQLNKVIKSTHLEQFVKNLDNGLNTKIGEKGSWISGGQTQRIAIARELYRNPSILILDEATTGLDEMTEEKILKKIIELKNEITIIIVSHNKNTLKICDQIINLDKMLKIKNDSI